MKVRLGYFLAGLAVASLIWFVSSHHMCGTRPAPEVSEAMNIHKAAYSWALDHGGEMPPDLAFLKSGEYLHPPVSDRVLAGVIEYRGKGMKISDNGKLLFLRYRAGNDKEVRVNLAGSGKGVPSSTPLPQPPPKDASPDPGGN